MSLQQNLWKAWMVQKKILSIHNIRADLNNKVQREQDLCAQLRDQKLALSNHIASCSKQESALDAQVISYNAALAKTKEQANQGLLDFEIAQEQCDALEAKIDTLEEEYFVIVEDRETKEKESFVCQQKITLHQRTLEETLQEKQERFPILVREEEALEEALEKHLALVPIHYQEEFEKKRFQHPNLVARLRDSFCGACLTRLPLGLVGEINRTSTVHSCPSCGAFCIASK